MISHIDHIVLTILNIEDLIVFYRRLLLMTETTFVNGRKALHFGDQKINLQTFGQELRNCAKVGLGDVCLI